MTTQPTAQCAARTTFAAGFGVRCLKANPPPPLINAIVHQSNLQEVHMPGDG